MTDSKRVPPPNPSLMGSVQRGAKDRPPALPDPSGHLSSTDQLEAEQAGRPIPFSSPEPPASADVNAAREAVFAAIDGDMFEPANAALRDFEAAIRAEAGTLDVERLARAMNRAHLRSLRTGDEYDAESIAAEYARLRKEE